MNLQQIGLKYGTDKSRHKIHKNSNTTYLEIYEKFFLEKRNENLVICEIGTLNGESARTWEEYFPNADIHMIDINPNAKTIETERIKVHIGSQNDTPFLTGLINEVKNFDIIIDDGSHIVNHQIKTFNTLYPYLNEGGVYIIEDLRNSYEENIKHLNLRNDWPGMHYNDRNDSLTNCRTDFNNFLLSNIKQLDNMQTEKLFSIHSYPMIIVFENI